MNKSSSLVYTSVVKTQKQAFRAYLIIAAVAVGIATVPAHAANIIVNGDFETGDFTGWTGAGTADSIVSGGDQLAGTYSAKQEKSGGGIYQSFTPITTAVTTSFIFKATDPGGATDRSMNVYWGQGDWLDATRINLRLVDAEANDIGDVEVYTGSGWSTALTDAVTFGATTSLTLTINEFGAGFNYDITVVDTIQGTNTATGLTATHSGATKPTSFNVFSLVSSNMTTGSSVIYDNISVIPIPEPCTAALLALAGLALLHRRRRR